MGDRGGDARSQVAGRRSQVAGRRLQDAGCRMQDAGCRIRGDRSSEMGDRSSEFGVRRRDAGCRFQDAGCRMRDADERGMRGRRPLPARRCRASTGPRSDERGMITGTIGASQIDVLQRGRARMSAECLCRGGLGADLKGLQRGRARMSAECSPTSPSTPAAKVALQRGRARMSAECRQVSRGQSRGPFRASTGPRSDERGMVWVFGAREFAIELQRGRARMSAEWTRPTNRQRPFPPLQRGRARMSAECLPVAGLALPPDRFNGAALG